MATFAQQVARFMVGLQFPTAGEWDDCPQCAGSPLKPAPCQCCGTEAHLKTLHALDPNTGPVHREVCERCHTMIFERR